MGWFSILLVDKCVHIYSHFLLQFLARDDVLIFWGFLKEFLQMLNIRRIYGSTMSTLMVFLTICHTYCLPKFDHQTLNCASIRYIVSVKTSHALPRQKNWFCSKVFLDDFNPLLRSIASSWIHIGAKESPRPAVYTTWKIWKKCKTQLCNEKQIRAPFFVFVPLEYFPDFMNCIFWWFRE